nr:immunoglobulin domain-containing protein [Allomuricauda sp.]
MKTLKHLFVVSLIFLLGCIKISAQSISVSDSLALVDLYNSTNGANWNINTNWLQPNIPARNWWGVDVRSDGTLWRITLTQNNLSGPIPSSFGNLTGLEEVNFWRNNLTGSIPTTIGQLTNMVELKMDENQLDGSIPTEIGQLTNLVSLELDANQLTGSIPSTINQLTNLEVFNITNNQISGSIPTSIGQLSNLRILHLGQNNLNGTIPTTLGQLTNVTSLSIYLNQITGSLPTELGNMTNLSILSLSNNSISGTLPQELLQLSNLTVITIGNNQLNGSIPSNINQLTNLGVVDLSNNQLSGTIPSAFNSITGLSTLYLNDNQLSGAIPSQLDQLQFGTNFRLRITNNNYSFSDLEANHSNYSSLLEYFIDPQSKVDEVESLSVDENGSITLTSTDLTSANNSYQWYKDDVAISGATSKDYVISNASASDAGVYHLEATNSIVTGLTLTRNDITLNVNADTCGVSATEKQALLDLYNSTNGASWTNTVANNQPWDTNIPVCDWYGVTVSNGDVIRVQIPSNNVVGTIPQSISDLTNLQTLHLYSNSVSGTIPTSLGSLTSLTQLWLYNNQLSGSIPTELGQLTSMLSMYLYGNQLLGSIPTALGNMTSLTDIRLNNNQLTGNVPTELSQLSNVTRMYLQDNNLTGTIPTSLGNLSNMVDLRISGNQLDGSIPTQFGQLSNLFTLDLSSNMLTGTIPTELGQLTNLDALYLDDNQLTGPIPTELGQASSLRQVYLQNNALSGSFAITMSQLTNLQRLYVYQNNLVFSNIEGDYVQLNSNIGSEYRFVPQAKVDQEETLAVLENGSITLTSTALTSTNNSYQWYKDGQVIAGATSKDYVISNATAADAGVYHFTATNSVVTGLTLTRNDITLTVTPDTCGVSATERQALLDLYNSTNGANWTNTVANNQPWDINIPVCDWYGVTVVNGNVTELKLTNNLNGNLPSSIGNLVNLQILKLTSNQLTGNIPVEIGQLQNLTHLEFDFNQLTGTIPSGIGQFQNLLILDLRFNQLNGGIPSELGQLSNLQRLDLNSNQLSGAIPAELGQLQNLIHLTLQHNQLTSNIPSQLGNILSLVTLKLNDNDINGSIPSELGQLLSLTDLSLSGNQISGTLPSELGNLSSLEFLNVYDNQISGTIPTQFSQLTNLKYLGLQRNNLMGTIPSSLGLLANLTHLELQQNQLSGSIPSELGQLSNLLSFDLYGNNLTGIVPTEVELLTNLFVFAIQENDLTGNIPSGLSLLTNLFGLTFHSNRFVFSDFENEHGTYTNLTTYQFTPQSKVDLEESLSVADGGSITLTSTALTSTNNSYQWYKDGQAIAGATNKDYVISNATAADAGVYYFTATNSVVTGLTLTRNDITLTIGSDPCGVSETAKQALLDLYSSTDGANWTNTLANNQPWDTNIPVCDWYGVTVVNGNVTEINLDNNNLNGSFPVNIGNLSDLQSLSLILNSISGSIPTDISDLTDLTYIALSNNTLNDNLNWITSLNNLQSLYLNNNNFNGSIPTDIGNLTNLVNLDITNNQIQGAIPASIGNLSSLSKLYLSQNQLTGTIPSQIGQLSSLLNISLAHNQLNGSLPVEIGQLNSLISLYLNNNQLSGAIPSEINGLSNLAHLIIGDNQFVGNLPLNSGNLSSLRNLDLRNNGFSGTFPNFTAISLTSLRFQNNEFIFSDFETEHSQYTTNNTYYDYSPQANVDQEEVLTVQEFSSITLTSNDLSSANNIYQWYKDNVAIPGATSKDYVITNATAADAGVYYFEATNSVVTGLTLTRNDITLNVEPGSNTVVQQQFCSSDGIHTVADLVIPTPTGVTPVWYASQTGGTPLSDSEVLQNNTVYWRDYTGNTNGRAGVEAIIDWLLPIGEPVQSFDATNNPTLANVVVALHPSSSATQVQWFATSTSTTVLPSSTLLVDQTIYYAAENASTCRLAVRMDVSPQEVCTVVVTEGTGGSSAIDGSFEGASNVIIPNNRNEAMGASGWGATLGTPDTFSTPYANTNDPYLQSSFTASPNGGICAGGLRYQNGTEAFAANISGLQTGINYVVEFYMANVTNTATAANSKETLGYWEVTFAGTTKSTPLMGANVMEATTWKRERLEFNASSATQLLEFKVGANALSQDNAYPVYMLIDGVRVYEKPQSISTTVCATVETQVFCNTSDENPPTVADLESPTGDSVTWHSSPFGGIRYFETTELGSITSEFVWADEGNGDPRIPVEILLDLGAPEGDGYQAFDVADSPTLANLVVVGTNITWHASTTSTDVLPTSTPLVNNATYYAAQDGNPCRLSVQVFVGIPTLEGDANQEFCGSSNPIVANLIMQPTNPGYTVIWYNTKEGGTALNSTDSLVDGQTYYASQTDGSSTSEERYPVQVTVIDTAAESQLYERNVEVAAGTTLADLTTFFELDAGVLWYDFQTSGTAYSNAYTVIDGETYYARISEGICDALEVLAVTVAIEDVSNPELVTCIKFLPQPGNRYVISGWVREHAATAVPTNSLEFTEKETFIELLDHLTAKILNKEQIPPVYEPHKDPEAPNVNALLPFIRNFTGTNVTVYNFQFETEQIGLQQVAVGYSFALAPDNLYRFEYRTPEVAYQLYDVITGNPSGVLSLGYHHPILNYDQLEIEYTDVVVVGNIFRITSNYDLTGATNSKYKTSYIGHTSDSSTDSGIESNVQLFDYVEANQHEVMDYLNTSITLEYLDENSLPITLDSSSVLFEPTGAIIDGWQRISGDFTIPVNAANMKIYLKNEGAGLNAYFDDVRMHPFDSNLKSFVYDPITQRLQAELDENNYATFYEYDTEGGLVRVKKETERGVYTIQETRSGNSKLNNGSE